MTSEPPPTVALRAAAHVESRVLEDRAVLVDLVSGAVVTLNPVATHAWERLRSGTTVAALIASTVERFDVDGDTARRDIEAFLADLTRRGFIREDS